MTTLQRDFRLMNEYKETFGENFPTMCFLGASISELNDMIKRCLDEKKVAKKLFSLDYTNKY